MKEETTATTPTYVVKFAVYGATTPSYESSAADVSAQLQQLLNDGAVQLCSPPRATVNGASRSSITATQRNAAVPRRRPGRAAAMEYGGKATALTRPLAPHPKPCQNTTKNQESTPRIGKRHQEIQSPQRKIRN